MTFADVPGLLPGAHRNRGLGHDFLRHVERCRVHAYIVDATGGDGKNRTANFSRKNKRATTGNTEQDDANERQAMSPDQFRIATQESEVLFDFGMLLINSQIANKSGYIHEHPQSASS